ncbi:MSMEG_0565 family glycosyltransferase [uncultured Methylibium sp.]|uniref:MSMEG_0565 family glycosyltransferase n=1 Tax=uncultured Methylibium sp. TaxID=381093 RepID=UPI0025F283FA|nr:MSMEG_0565 family glycosyltransferase [uncultured Methylibium sp.]
MAERRLPTCLRVALLTHSVNPRGGVVHTLELADALHEAGHDVTVLAPAQPGQRMFRPSRCRVELVPVGPAPRDLAEMVAARRDAFIAHLAPRLAETPWDVLHAQDGIGGNALATLRERGLIPGFVRTVHHLDHFDDARVMAWQQRAFVQARRVLCVSRTWCEILQREHGVDAALVPNGVDLRRHGRERGAADARVARRWGLRGGAAAPVFLAVGGIEERKNTVRVLQAFAAVRAVQPEAQLVIAGGASLLDHDRYGAEFTAALAASGLAVGPGRAVVITGAVPDEELPALMRAADALVMASLREGFGLVVLEALACGTPVVVSRIAPFTEYLIADEPAVCWADPADPLAIARAMQEAAGDPRHRQALAQDVPAVCRRHSWAASALRHVALYRELLAERAASPAAAAAAA